MLTVHTNGTASYFKINISCLSLGGLTLPPSFLRHLTPRLMLPLIYNLVEGGEPSASYQQL